MKKFEINKATTWNADRRKKSGVADGAEGAAKGQNAPAPAAQPAPPPPPEDGGGMLARLLAKKVSENTPGASSSGLSLSSNLSSSHGTLSGSDDFFSAFKNALSCDKPFNALDAPPPEPESWTAPVGPGPSDDAMGDPKDEAKKRSRKTKGEGEKDPSPPKKKGRPGLR